MPDAVRSVIAALLAQSQVSPTPAPPPGGTSIVETIEANAHFIVVALIAAIASLVVAAMNRRKNRADTLEKQQQMFDRHLEQGDELRRRERHLDAREDELNKREAALQQGLSAGDDAPSVWRDLEEELRRRRRQSNGNEEEL